MDRSAFEQAEVSPCEKEGGAKADLQREDGPCPGAQDCRRRTGLARPSGPPRESRLSTCIRVPSVHLPNSRWVSPRAQRVPSRESLFLGPRGQDASSPHSLGQESTAGGTRSLSSHEAESSGTTLPPTARGPRHSAGSVCSGAAGLRAASQGMEQRRVLAGIPTHSLGPASSRAVWSHKV